MAVYLGSNEVNLKGGQPMENGLPSGGLTGQVLAKSSNDDYVAAWTTVYDVPAGGSVGQVLAKSSDDDYAFAWMSIESDPALPSGGLNGQVLAKSSNDDYAVAWSTLPPGEFVITVTQTSTSGSGVFSMNKTIAQVKAAIGSGQHVVIYFKFTAYSQFGEPGNLKRFPYKQTAYGYYEFENDFIDINSGYTELCSYLFKINTSSGAISLTRESAYGVAAGSSKYVGKFLGAVEGYSVPMLPEWQTIYQVPAEGSNGQFLKKTGSSSADYAWADLITPFVATFTNAPDKPERTLQCDKTVSAVETAAANGLVLARYNNSVFSLERSNGNFCEFSRLAAGGGELSCILRQWIVYTQDTCEYSEYYEKIVFIFEDDDEGGYSFTEYPTSEYAFNAIRDYRWQVTFPQITAVYTDHNAYEPHVYQFTGITVGHDETTGDSYDIYEFSRTITYDSGNGYKLAIESLGIAASTDGTMNFSVSYLRQKETSVS